LACDNVTVGMVVN